MLNERAARACTYDKTRRTARLELGSGAGAARETRGTVLLDAKGGVVGVDVEPTSSSRVVVMVGKHEAVKTTRDARLSVSRDSSGEVVAVDVHDHDAP